MKNLNITIVGGGNIGTQFIVHFAEQGHNVTLYTSHPEDFSAELSIVDENNKIVHKSGKYNAIKNAREAFGNAEIVFITVPAFAMKKIAESILSYVKQGIKIVGVPGTGGFEWAFKDCIDAGAQLFGLQRVPSVARLVEYGKIVKTTGYRELLYCGSISNTSALAEICNLLEEAFKIECKPLLNYLSVALTPSNPILHTARLYNIFRDFSSKEILNEISLFYED